MGHFRFLFYLTLLFSQSFTLLTRASTSVRLPNVVNPATNFTFNGMNTNHLRCMELKKVLEATKPTNDQLSFTFKITCRSINHRSIFGGLITHNGNESDILLQGVYSQGTGSGTCQSYRQAFEDIISTEDLLAMTTDEQHQPYFSLSAKCETINVIGFNLTITIHLHTIP